MEGCCCIHQPIIHNGTHLLLHATTGKLLHACYVHFFLPSVASSSIILLMMVMNYFHSPSRSSFFVSVSAFAHLPFFIFQSSRMLLHCNNYTIYPPFASNSHLPARPHLQLARCNLYTTRTRDCEHQQYRHCRPRIYCAFFLWNYKEKDRL